MSTAFVQFTDVGFPDSFGPIFGAGADLSIASDCDVNDDSYMSPHSYDSGAADGDCEYFRVRDYEVFVPMLSNA